MRSTGSIVLLVVLLLVGFAGCAGCGSYNSLVAQDERVERAWADVENQFQRRADLVDNLVATVQGAADFESETLIEVTQARQQVQSAGPVDLSDPANVEQYQQTQTALAASLGSLINVVREDYPELSATEGFRDLQVQLEGTENRIATARRDYNGEVQTYNTSVRSFPTTLFAGLMGFDRRVPFEADAGAADAPEVSFD